MNNIETLIAQLCPKGVEFKELGEICEYIRGITYSKKDEIQGTDGIKVLRANNISLKTNTLNFNDVRIVSNTVRVKENQKLKENDILICAASGSKDHIGKVAYIFKDMDFTFGGFMAVLRAEEILINRFLFHLLIGQSFSKYLESALNTTTINNLNSQIMNGFQIPLPPLPIQQEIVNILDKFTQLEAELEAELEARKKQYEFYRNQLLVPIEVSGKWLMNGQEVEWKTLGEVCLKTENIKWKINQNIDYQYIDLSSVSRDNNKISETQTINSTNAPSRAQQIVNKDDIIFGTTRPTLKRYSLITSKFHNQICSTGFCVLRANKEILLPKFLFFILTTTGFYNYIENNQEGAGYPSISNSKVKIFPIPIPPIAEQERIVGILDKFDALVNDISVGLPAEIQARRKQYEYYRGKLLDFKNMNTNN